MLGQIARGIDNIPGKVFERLPKKAKESLTELRTKIDDFLTNRTTLSRVESPGNNASNYGKYKTNNDVPGRYSNDPRFNDLASDPAHIGKEISPKSRQEAMAGLEAETQKLVEPPIERGPKEIEFFDGDGMPYDVKTPPSPKLGDRWTFNANQSADSIVDELRKTKIPNNITGQPATRGVILDSSYLNNADHKALWGKLAERLSDIELSRIIEVNTKQ